MSTEVIGYTKAELIEAMLDAGIHTSVDKFRELAIELQRRAVGVVRTEGEDLAALIEILKDAK